MACHGGNSTCDLGWNDHGGLRDLDAARWLWEQCRWHSGPNLRPIEAGLADGGIKMEDVGGNGHGGLRDHNADQWLWEQCRWHI